MYTSKTTRRNVGVSYNSQDEADLQAAQMDENDCFNCVNCVDCIGCRDCRDCRDCRYCRYCRYCTGCIGCRNCRNCVDCHYCRYCTDCRDCRDCRDCTTCSGCYNCRNCRYCTNCRDCRDCTDCRDCMMWHGQPASNLLSINGLRWPVSTDGDSIQIGCKHHSVEEWRSFDESVIASMDRHALGVYKAYRDTVLALADARKRM